MVGTRRSGQYMKLARRFLPRKGPVDITGWVGRKRLATKGMSWAAASDCGVHSRTDVTMVVDNSLDRRP